MTYTNADHSFDAENFGYTPKGKCYHCGLNLKGTHPAEDDCSRNPDSAANIAALEASD